MAIALATTSDSEIGAAKRMKVDSYQQRVAAAGMRTANSAPNTLVILRPLEGVEVHSFDCFDATLVARLIVNLSEF
jgi:hypothetical protein